MLSHRTGLLLITLVLAGHTRLQSQRQPLPNGSDTAVARPAATQQGIRVQKHRESAEVAPLPPAASPPPATAPAPAAPSVVSGMSFTTGTSADPRVESAATPEEIPALSPEEWRSRLALLPLRERVVAVPGASVSSPTAFALHGGEAFLGGAYQARTRYTDLQDAALVMGVGLGNRDRLVAVELAATSYATVRDGGPFSDGSLSAKVHRAFGRDLGVAVGVENAVRWGRTDAGVSVYGAATRLLHLRKASSALFSSAALTLGVGNGRFRSEEDIVAGRKTANVFGAVGVRVAEPVSLTADWTGQDLYAAVSVRPVRHIPLVATVGVADITGSAGDGARLIVSAGYGFRIPRLP